MLSVDSELQVAVASLTESVRDFRVQLWAEHAGIDFDETSPAIRAALQNETDALGLWRRSWTDGHRWFDGAESAPGAATAQGFSPTGLVRADVGPGDHP